MSIGFASLTYGVPGTGLKTCRAQNATEEKLMSLIDSNLQSLEKIMDYNIQHGIHLFRISSDLIPFGSSPVNTLPWEQLFADKLTAIGEKIKMGNIRVSMHPGQYTVLNSPDEAVAEKAVEDLMYHVKLLEGLNTGTESKIVLHVGGVYQDRAGAMARFVDNYRKLPQSIKDRLVIENDDKSYTIAEVLEICTAIGAPAIYDNLHNALNPADPSKEDSYWIKEVGETWQEKDGKQKIHYSQQNPDNRAGSHSNTIAIREFLDFYYAIQGQNIDIMLEVKDKNLSALKCIHCIEQEKDEEVLEREWTRYQYALIERSPVIYRDICEKLENSSQYSVIDFYEQIEDALKQEVTPANAENAALHFWENLKEKADDKERKAFFSRIDRLKRDTGSVKAIKNLLQKIALKYNQQELLHSYYFLF